MIEPNQVYLILFGNAIFRVRTLSNVGLTWLCVFEPSGYSTTTVYVDESYFIRFISTNAIADLEKKIVQTKTRYLLP